MIPKEFDWREFTIVTLTMSFKSALTSCHLALTFVDNKKRMAINLKKRIHFSPESFAMFSPLIDFSRFASCFVSILFYWQPIWQQAGTKSSPFSTLSGLRFTIKGSAGLHLRKQDNLICVSAQPTLVCLLLKEKDLRLPQTPALEVDHQPGKRSYFGGSFKF